MLIDKKIVEEGKRESGVKGKEGLYILMKRRERKEVLGSEQIGCY